MLRIIRYQQLIRKIPVADNVMEYAVKLWQRHVLTPQWQQKELISLSREQDQEPLSSSGRC